MKTCPRAAVGLLEWLSSTLVDGFADDARRNVSVTLSRADHARLRTLLAWLRRNGHVGSDAFPDLPDAKPLGTRNPRGPFKRGRCVECGRTVAVRGDGKARFHRGSEACRNGGQTVDLLGAAPRETTGERE